MSNPTDNPPPVSAFKHPRYYECRCVKSTTTNRMKELEYDGDGNILFHRTGFSVTFNPGFVRWFAYRNAAEAYADNWGGKENWVISRDEDEPAEVKPIRKEVTHEARHNRPAYKRSTPGGSGGAR